MADNDERQSWWDVAGAVEERTSRPGAEKPIGEMDRIIDPDVPHSLDQIEPPRFKNTTELYEHREAEREEQEHKRAAERVRQLHESEEEHATSVQRERTWGSQEGEREAVEEHSQRLSAFQQQEAAFRQQVPRWIAMAQQLAAAGRQAEAERLIEQTKQVHARLAGEHQWLTQRAQQGIEHNATKELRAKQRELLRLAPELQDPRIREGFVIWCQNEGIPRSVVLGEGNVLTVVQAFKRFKELTQERVDGAKRAVIAKTVPVSLRGPGSDTDSKDARKSLSERGKFDDARNYLALRRAERNWGL